MALTPLQVQDVCYGQASLQIPWGLVAFRTPCKYLTHATVGSKFVQLCMKKAPGIVADKLAKGQLPSDFDKLKDNCPGYLYLKRVDQGYDVKPKT
jgi:hypothetical protein